MKNCADGGGAGDVVRQDEEAVLSWDDAEAVALAKAVLREEREMLAHQENKGDTENKMINP